MLCRYFLLGILYQSNSIKIKHRNKENKLALKKL